MSSPFSAYLFIAGFVVVFLAIIYALHFAAAPSSGLTISSAIQTNTTTYTISCFAITLVVCLLVLLEASFPAPLSSVALPFLVLSGALLICTASITHAANPTWHAACAGSALLFMALVSMLWISDAPLPARAKALLCCTAFLTAVGFATTFASRSSVATATTEWIAVGIWIAAMLAVLPARDTSRPIMLTRFGRVAVCNAR